MELSDYVRMLRRGWPTIVVFVLACLGLTAVYLTFAPKTYQAVATVFVTTTDVGSVGALQTGSQFGSTAVSTYANIIDSAIVLGPVAGELRPQADANELLAQVSASARDQTSLIDIAVTGDDPERVVTVANAAAEMSQTVLPELGSQGGRSSPLEIVVIQRAITPDQALSPDTQRTLAIGLIIGLCLGLATTIAFQALDTRLRRPEDIARVTGARVLAALPPLRRAQRRTVVVNDEPTGQVGEAYRSLRTNLGFTEDSERRTLLFSAAGDDRDGAQIPLNLAWSLAQAGRSVILVDLDLRRSPVGSMLGLPDGLGVAEVLAAKVDLSEVVLSSPHEHLDVLMSGALQPSPSDLLSSPRLPAVLRRLEQNWDFVVLHAPGLLAYTDAAVIARISGWTVVTLAAGRTRAAELTTALATLANVGVDPAGIVVAGARRSARENRRLRGPFIRLLSPPMPAQPRDLGSAESQSLPVPRRSSVD